ncbi:uncharacterized protein LOC125047737 isoform X2 [Penaeus chinensis]|uniref:uncharacterized protein LOC125047737 isoform X2 n=1 Tax=Penaeus chinensis TaxID=139456 RepID=UPI001FB73183|nr:uncharacterized protein LOC125047737 isoform X2 [Penaeus chinensis]
MTDVSPHLNILLLVSPQKTLGPPTPSRMRAKAPEQLQPTESSERATSTETDVDRGTGKDSQGNNLGWAPPEGHRPMTYGYAMPTTARPRQRGKDFGTASPPQATLGIDSLRVVPRERQVVGPESLGFSPAFQFTSERSVAFGGKGLRSQPHSIGPADAARGPHGGMASSVADSSIPLGSVGLPWETAPSHRFLHTPAAAARPGSPTKTPLGSGSGRPATTTGVGARGTSGKQAHKSPPEGLMRRLWEVALLTLLLVTPAAGHFDRGGPQHRITWGRGNTANSAVFGDTPTNVTAVLGHRARLPCQVKNLGLKDVSWIRQRDLHILTVGIFTYTSDDRFKVFHPPETEDWYLDISSVTFRDAGVYECQVSTSPKVSLPVYLTVLGVQEADIPGPSEVFIQHGSTISLLCEVRAGVEAVGPVQWLRGSTPLNYSSPRGGISMELAKSLLQPCTAAPRGGQRGAWRGGQLQQPSPSCSPPAPCPACGEEPRSKVASCTVWNVFRPSLPSVNRCGCLTLSSLSQRVLIRVTCAES